jgi:hypothetical protein
MSIGDFHPVHQSTAWVHLSKEDITIRGQRGDKIAYIFRGKQLETYPDAAFDAEPLDTISVLPKGWIGLQHVRLTAERWVKTKSKHCASCGGLVLV